MSCLLSSSVCRWEVPVVMVLTQLLTHWISSFKRGKIAPQYGPCEVGALLRSLMHLPINKLLTVFDEFLNSYSCLLLVVKRPSALLDWKKCLKPTAERVNTMLEEISEIHCQKKKSIPGCKKCLYINCSKSQYQFGRNVSGPTAERVTTKFEEISLDQLLKESIPVLKKCLYPNSERINTRFEEMSLSQLLKESIPGWKKCLYTNTSRWQACSRLRQPKW